MRRENSVTSRAMTPSVTRPRSSPNRPSPTPPTRSCNTSAANSACPTSTPTISPERAAARLADCLGDGRDDLAVGRAEADPRAVLAAGGRRDRHLVVVLQPGPGGSVGQRQRLGAVPGPHDPGAALVRLRGAGPFRRGQGPG